MHDGRHPPTAHVAEFDSWSTPLPRRITSRTRNHPDRTKSLRSRTKCLRVLPAGVSGKGMRAAGPPDGTARQPGARATPYRGAWSTVRRDAGSVTGHRVSAPLLRRGFLRERGSGQPRKRMPDKRATLRRLHAKAFRAPCGGLTRGRADASTRTVGAVRFFYRDAKRGAQRTTAGITQPSEGLPHWAGATGRKHSARTQGRATRPVKAAISAPAGENAATNIDNDVPGKEEKPTPGGEADAICIIPLGFCTLYDRFIQPAAHTGRNIQIVCS